MERERLRGLGRPLGGHRQRNHRLAAGVIRVERGWDPVEGVIDAKTKAGRRSVPITATLRDVLVEHKLATGRDGDDLVFGTTATDPLVPCNQRRRALTAWKAAKLNPITPHECRHTFASIGIAAGLNAKALSTFMGHPSVSITLDRYGHLMPGSEDEAAGLLDAYLLRSAEGHRRGSEAPEGPGSTGDNRKSEGDAIPHQQPVSAV